MSYPLSLSWWHPFVSMYLLFQLFLCAVIAGVRLLLEFL